MSIIFIILASMCNALMDTLSTRYDVSIFRNFKNQQFWDWRISWKNKWKNGNIRNGESFFLSSTMLSALTDGWHLAKGLMLGFISLAVVMYVPMYGILDACIFCIVWGMTFEFSYNKLFKA
jgi:hypothetical protein